MKRRDLLLRRYWRREEDGTYGILFYLELYSNLKVLKLSSSQLSVAVILYHSVVHKKCQPQNGYVRASVKSNVCFDSEIRELIFISSVSVSCMAILSNNDAFLPSTLELIQVVNVPSLCIRLCS